jgi:hypothetical protein
VVSEFLKSAMRRSHECSYRAENRNGSRPACFRKTRDTGTQTTWREGSICAMGDAASVRTLSVNLVDGGVVAHAHEEHGSLNNGRIACTGSMQRNVQEHRPTHRSY